MKTWSTMHPATEVQRLSTTVPLGQSGRLGCVCHAHLVRCRRGLLCCQRTNNRHTRRNGEKLNLAKRVCVLLLPFCSIKRCSPRLQPDIDVLHTPICWNKLPDDAIAGSNTTHRTVEEASNLTFCFFAHEGQSYFDFIDFPTYSNREPLFGISAHAVQGTKTTP